MHLYAPQIYSSNNLFCRLTMDHAMGHHHGMMNHSMMNHSMMDHSHHMAHDPKSSMELPVHNPPMGNCF